jgi:group I intron endonuclease
MIGIYKITNKLNNKCYIGQSKDIKRRFYEHKLLHRNETLSLKRALKKYGVENFSFEVLEETSIEELNEREIYYIAQIKPAYNRTLGGQGAKGHEVSVEVRNKLVEKGKLFWERLPSGTKARIIENNLKGPRIGHEVFEETRELLRQHNLNKKQSFETIEKRKNTLLAKKANGYKQTNVGHFKKVQCVDLDLSFKSIKEASEKLNIPASSISAVLKSRYTNTRGYHFIYL